MGEVRISLPNFITVGLMSFVFVWAARKAITKFAPGVMPEAM